MLSDFTKRRLKLLAFFLISIWIGGFGGFIIITTQLQPHEPNTTQLIVTLTGDAKRITEGIALLTKSDAKTLLISGVGPGVTMRDFGIDPVYFQQNNKHIILGRTAHNTYGNALEANITAKVLGYTSICIVTSDYHMIRSYLAFWRYNPDIELSTYPIPTSGGKSGSLRKAWLLIREYNATISLLFMWGIEDMLTGYDQGLHRLVNRVRNWRSSL